MDGRCRKLTEDAQLIPCPWEMRLITEVPLPFFSILFRPETWRLQDYWDYIGIKYCDSLNSPDITGIYWDYIGLYLIIGVCLGRIVWRFDRGTYIIHRLISWIILSVHRLSIYNHKQTSSTDHATVRYSFFNVYTNFANQQGPLWDEIEDSLDDEYRSRDVPLIIAPKNMTSTYLIWYTYIV